MAHTKSAGRARQGTPRKGRRLGIKIYGGQEIKNGQIIVRQIGSTLHPGEGAKMGRDFTIFALKDGKVNFRVLKGKKMVEVI
ncbi:MAG: bL27 family ribosomal protein [Patescibacteria group bacterium]|nr:bL27 family ribosomal protein [Patescibacteria group bacterium]